jgi:putative Ca2+/H+ antiporter (TMEM165/GDT1 family)
MISVFVAAYVTVLLAEILGDKSIYTIGSLTMRFGVPYVLAGVSVAFAAKMGVAVLIGRSIATFPQGIVAAASSLTFLGSAIILWRKRPASEAERGETVAWPRAAAVAFGTIFLSEWLDVGQLATAALIARFSHPFLIWLGATMAMMTKAIFAVALGLGLRKSVSQARLRYVACAVCLLMGILSATAIRF